MFMYVESLVSKSSCMVDRRREKQVDLYFRVQQRLARDFIKKTSEKITEGQGRRHRQAYVGYDRFMIDIYKAPL